MPSLVTISLLLLLGTAEAVDSRRELLGGKKNKGKNANKITNMTKPTVVPGQEKKSRCPPSPPAPYGSEHRCAPQMHIQHRGRRCARLIPAASTSLVTGPSVTFHTDPPPNPARAGPGSRISRRGSAGATGPRRRSRPASPSSPRWMTSAVPTARLGRTFPAARPGPPPAETEPPRPLQPSRRLQTLQANSGSTATFGCGWAHQTPLVQHVSLWCHPPRRADGG